MEKRFEIASFDIDEPSVLIDNDTYQVILTLSDYCYDEINFLENLLNEQDEKIKELEEIVGNGNQKLNEKYFEKIYELDEEYNRDLDERLKEIEKLKQENQQLKQSQNQKAIEVLEKVMKKRYIVDLDLREDVEFIIDLKANKDLDMVDVEHLLNEQDEKIKQLKQTQNQKALGVLGKILGKYEFFQNSDDSTLVEPIPDDTMTPFYTYILEQISELRGKDNG